MVTQTKSLVKLWIFQTLAIVIYPHHAVFHQQLHSPQFQIHSIWLWHISMELKSHKTFNHGAKLSNLKDNHHQTGPKFNQFSNFYHTPVYQDQPYGMITTTVIILKSMPPTLKELCNFWAQELQLGSPITVGAVPSYNHSQTQLLKEVIQETQIKLVHAVNQIQLVLQPHQIHSFPILLTPLLTLLLMAAISHHKTQLFNSQTTELVLIAIGKIQLYHSNSLWEAVQFKDGTTLEEIIHAHLLLQMDQHQAAQPEALLLESWQYWLYSLDYMLFE